MTSPLSSFASGMACCSALAVKRNPAGPRASIRISGSFGDCPSSVSNGAPLITNCVRRSKKPSGKSSLRALKYAITRSMCASQAFDGCHRAPSCSTNRVSSGHVPVRNRRKQRIARQRERHSSPFLKKPGITRAIGRGCAHANTSSIDVRGASCRMLVQVGGGSSSSLRLNRSIASLRRQPLERGRLAFVVFRDLALRHARQEEPRVVAANLDLRRHPMRERHEIVDGDAARWPLPAARAPRRRDMPLRRRRSDRGRSRGGSVAPDGGRSPSSTRPPGNTYDPAMNATLSLRRTIRISNGSPGRSTTTVACGTTRARLRVTSALHYRRIVTP